MGIVIEKGLEDDNDGSYCYCEGRCSCEQTFTPMVNVRGVFKTHAEARESRDSVATDYGTYVEVHYVPNLVEEKDWENE